MKKILLLCGGVSPEHKVSLISAKNVFENLNREKYSVDILYISRQWVWKFVDEQIFLTYFSDCEELEKRCLEKEISISLSSSDSFGILQQYDAWFSLIHWAFGEDGVLQGLARFLKMPLVGCDLLSSAICMDKDVTKRLLRDAGLPIVPFVVVSRFSAEKKTFFTLQQELGEIFFVKPANCWSSVGVSKVDSEESYLKALEQAFQYDTKVLLEQAIQCTEIECSVLGNQELVVSVPWAIVNHSDFYSYEAKYLDASQTEFHIPAHLSDELKKKIMDLAKKSFQVLGCRGMARVDFFLDQNETIFINEINTIPGFTTISMYPKLLMASGISYADLLDRLIELAGESSIS